MNVILAKFGTITGSDFFKGLVVSIFTTATAALYTIFQTNTLPTVPQLRQIGFVAFCAGVSYLLKNLLTNSQDQVFAKEPKEPVAAVTPAALVPAAPVAISLASPDARVVTEIPVVAEAP